MKQITLGKTGVVSLLLAASAMTLPVLAQEHASGYSQPPKYILDVMRAPATPAVYLNTTRDYALLVSQEEYPSIERVATPYLRLAGVRLEPGNRSRHDTPGGYGITPCAERYDLMKVADGSLVHVELPKSGCSGFPAWSADGKHFALTHTTASGVQLWIGDGQTGKLRQMVGVQINPMLDNDMQWMPDQKSLLVKMVPAKPGAAPSAAKAVIAPSIQESDGKSGQSSTYEVRDTLNNAHDEEVFDYYAKSQMAVIDIVSGKIRLIGEVGLYDGVEVSPDGKNILIETLHKPYSYVTTYDHFPHEVNVWSNWQAGKPSVKHVASLPLADRVPIHGVPSGPRDFSWRQNAPATLIWVEALDGGDWANTVPERDKIMSWRAPFDGSATEFLRTQQRYAGLWWGQRTDVAMVSEYDHNRHWRKTTIINPDDKSVAARVLWDMSSEEKYGNPGSVVFRRQPNGSVVMRMKGDVLYLSGNGASPDGDRPFLDRLDLNTLKTERLFRSSKDAFERFVGFAGEDENRFFTWHQSVMDPPNMHLLTLGAHQDAAAGEAVFASTSSAVTHIQDPSPEVRAIKKRLVRYKRADGVDLSFTLYTPPGYKEGTRVPTILYAYPLDYADASKAGQVSGSQATFTRLRNYRFLLLAGYAIIDNAAFPIVGDPLKAYDNYMDQLVADAKAAVDEAVRLGVTDPERVGVTGHSHGALMTVNLLAHSDLFRAGVATSGSYNKTLTPFGFQNERRSVWNAQDVYLKVSPFFYANTLKTPLLIMHGGDDANPGTTPLQASKLFEAVRGNGGTTRLVMLPHEPHWYAARESNEQLVYEMLTWFDKYVKNAQARSVPGQGTTPAAH